ncbi:hypothetical protein GOP47_0009277 [Adiantum capillus-veneris]|uniref:Uncharacterized protein n=1 Tax=Adiantum capillus-veneris TaxID=13818 RepID=A0A9D4UWF7_ADICA|nr:hypothetical protein GOP47_0009277 [Adiantum capillus-veneris]
MENLMQCGREDNFKSRYAQLLIEFEGHPTDKPIQTYDYPSKETFRALFTFRSELICHHLNFLWYHEESM